MDLMKATETTWNGQQSLGRQALQTVVIAVAYFVFAKLGFVFALSPGNVTPVWIPSGIALAAMAFAPGVGAAGVWLGSFTANLHQMGIAPTALFVAAIIALGSTAQAGVAGYLLRRYVLRASPDTPQPEPLGVARRSLAAVVPATILAPLVGVGALFAGGLITGENLDALVLTWWAGDLAGMLVVGLPLLAWPQLTRRLGAVPVPLSCALALAMIGAGLVSYTVIAHQDRQEFRALLAQEARQLADQVSEDLQAQMLYGKAVAALFSLGNPVSERQFEEFGDSLLGGMSATLSFVPRVSAAQRATHEQVARDKGQIQYEIWERATGGARVRAGQREEYFPVRYIYPFEPNRNAIGLDLASVPNRRAALEGALKTNLPASTEPLALVQEPNAGKAILVVAPAWRGGAEWGKPRAKTEDFLGYSSIVIRLNKIFGQSMKSQGFRGRDAALFYLSRSTDAPQLVASSSAESAPQTEQGWLAQRRGQSDFAFAGANWRVTILPSGVGAGISAGRLLPWLILLFSVLLGSAVLLHARTVHNQQRELEESEKKFRHLVEASPAGLLLVDSAGRIVLSNAQFERDSGYDSGELAGQLVELLVPSRLAKAHAGYRRDFAAEPTTQPMLARPDLTVRRKDGSEFYAQIGLSPVQTGLERQILVSVSNLSERKRFEEHFRESQKLEALGQLTGGLAHDFNNLLGIVIGNLDLIREQLPESNEKLLERHRTALEAALRGAEVTRSLLAVARRQPLKVQVLDLNALISEMLALLSSSAGATVTVRLELCEEVLNTKVDAAGLSSALLNLVINARDAMEDMRGERTLVLRTRRAQGKEAQLETGEYAVLELADNGPGMSQEVKDRAFEPFFTTKALGRGTGLGLSMVRGFCEQLGGTARIDSELGRGTTVRLYLPVQARADT